MRYGSYNHKDVKHTSVALTESRSDAIARIAFPPARYFSAHAFAKMDFARHLS